MSDNNSEENRLRSTEVRKSLSRPQLVMGGEREPMLMLVLVVLALIIMTQTWPTFFLGIGLWICLVPLVRAMAKADPQMTQIFLRAKKYQKYYPARSTPHANP